MYQQVGEHPPKHSRLSNRLRMVAKEHRPTIVSTVVVAKAVNRLRMVAMATATVVVFSAAAASR